SRSQVARRCSGRGGSSRSGSRCRRRAPRRFRRRSGVGTGAALGVDIGSRSVKILLARSTAERLVIETAGSFDIPDGLVAGGVIVDPREFGRTLAKYLAHVGAESADAVFSVPSSLAVLRWLALPDLPPAELTDAARYKVKRHLPFPVESAYIAASRDSAADDGQAMVVAVPRAAIDSRAEAMLHAGLRPVHAEIEAQAILRVMERRLSRRGALWRDASLTILDIGGTSTHMYVVQSRRLQFIRGVKFGASIFHDAVARDLNIDLARTHGLMAHADTRLEKRGRLLIPMNGDTAIVNVEAELEKLTREFLRLMRYFRSLHPERSYAGILDHAVLCGGLVGLKGLDGFLQATLGLRIEMARPIAGLMTRFSPETFAAVSHRQEAFTTAMGLALAGLSHDTAGTGQEDGNREFVWKRAV
ncbi:type IV pilus assembly protein PilM, partial [bacterium]